jgi:hypothetical protein
LILLSVIIFKTVLSRKSLSINTSSTWSNLIFSIMSFPRIWNFSMYFRHSVSNSLKSINFRSFYFPLPFFIWWRYWIKRPRVIIGLWDINSKFFSSSFLVIKAAALVNSLKLNRKSKNIT